LRTVARGGTVSGSKPAVKVVTVMDADGMRRAITRIAHEILERNKGTEGLALIGIRSRGVHIADRIAAAVQAIERVDVLRGIVDITLYRDDLSRGDQTPQVRGTEIPFGVEGTRIVLIDDVLYTGRTIRAAMDALMDFGRPENIQLAVMIDRGHRELPIRADYVGKNLPTSRHQQVQVRIVEMDGVDDVILEG
jgi:pyrimidine operon attenuation protein/uracil phosphoribosyltransferase